MQLDLKNIGMIKEASVKIDGLTVIAGENDTGKSTVGKALYLINEFKKKDKQAKKSLKPMAIGGGVGILATIPFIPQVFIPLSIIPPISFWVGEKLGSSSVYKELSKKIFNFELPKKAKINLTGESQNIIFIDTPIITNFFDFFSILDTIQNDIDYEINNYPYLSRSLYKQLKLKLKKESTLNIHEQINTLKDIIDGELQTDTMGKLVFNKKDGSVHNINAVATGIKSFGILQLLIKNNHLTKDSILIIDEPEVHLHPKWQLEMAKVIVELVKNGVKILVNSHSPYMIQALIKYARDAEITDKSNFYLAQKEEEFSTFENVNEDLNKIFELLAEPMNKVYE